MSGCKRYFSLAPGGESKVGEMSPELRRALSLKEDMLPIWIYRMRVLGYPPAWLGEAQVTKTLNIFDDDEHNRTVEAGEVVDNEQTKYNKDAFHKFAGFNCPAPSSVRDDWILLSMPPMIENQQLSKAVNKTNCLEHVPYKKRKQTSSPASPEANGSNSDKSVEIDGNESLENVRCDKETSLDQTQEEEEVRPVEERKLSMIAMGTFVPKERKKLPGLEKWAVGMGELLHFENLPDSVGAYNSKIKGLIHKIRDKQKTGDSKQQ